ncbi:MAG: tRNA uridine-5-carboxymethylaminomethyl(34) synthesis GTPase MnmE [Syntrophales bacterium]|nr:tRNA uridine-5-carboxymethylaminomethyl(34) synthesis GTPase MnmE [Syntrophales bacterium]
MLEDTIAAIATPQGSGGIAVIRVSGPLAEEIYLALFKPRKPITHIQSHHLYHGDIISPETGALLDEVMVSFMRKPRSYTGEDVLEIYGHGGHILPQRILLAVVKAGARLAEPGEFTKRAFLNGRIDLSQAEAVADIISARTEKGLEVALSQLKGDLRGIIDRQIDHLTDILAQLEASIDFTEDLGDMPDDGGLLRKLQSMVRELENLSSSYDEGKIYRTGVSVVIAGRANVGKSSLLNRLLGERRAIVTPIPGTTRDFIEESVDIRGMIVRIVDTAGIRETDSDIEKAGIDLVWERVEAADAVIVLMDGSEALTDEDREILSRSAIKPIIPVINKGDLPQILTDEDVANVTPGRPVRISAKYDQGIDALKEAVYYHFTNHQKGVETSSAIITNIRYKLAIEKAQAFLSQASETASSAASPELIAADIRDALESLGEIGGKTLNDDVLDRIFSTFCVGK